MSNTKTAVKSKMAAKFKVAAIEKRHSGVRTIGSRTLIWWQSLIVALFGSTKSYYSLFDISKPQNIPPRVTLPPKHLLKSWKASDGITQLPIDRHCSSWALRICFLGRRIVMTMSDTKIAAKSKMFARSKMAAVETESRPNRFSYWLDGKMVEFIC